MRRSLRFGGAASLLAVIIGFGVVVARQGGPAPEAAATPTAVSSTTTTAVTTTTESTTTTTSPPDPGPPPPPVPHPGPPRFPTIVATATVPRVAIHDRPAGAVTQVLASPVAVSGFPLNFDVLENPGGGFLHVMLRTRPNGSTGWIRSTDVALTTVNWSIDVDVTARWITVYNGASVVLSHAVVTGTEYTPTPIGDFFVTEGVHEANKWGPHGPFIFGLSAHSDVWMTFDGGDGQIGIHGTNFPQLLGTASSNGCIRLDNDSIMLLAASVPMGTPVHIHA